MFNSNTITREQLAKTIDHALLKPDLTHDDVLAGLALAKEYQVASACVRPCDVKLAAQVLAGSGVLVCTVIGFPHGTTTTATKLAEGREALQNGCHELDMVLNISALRSGLLDVVRADIKGVVVAAHAVGAKVKVIFENAYLSDAQKRAACEICSEVRADWVKTSTGFAATGATVEDVRLMRASVGAHVQVKAAGGIRNLQTALAMIDEGCTRIGATATPAIVDGFVAWKAGLVVTAEGSGSY